MTLQSLITNFRMKYGHAPVEHIYVYKAGKLVSHKVGGKRSTGFGNCITDCDVIHNHPNGTPAFSDSDIIMTIYGGARSVTAVSAMHGSWTMARPSGGWPNISHTAIEFAFKKSLSEVKKSERVKKLVADIRARKVSMDEGDAIFNALWAGNAVRSLGLKFSSVRW